MSIQFAPTLLLGLNTRTWLIGSVNEPVLHYQSCLRTSSLWEWRAVEKNVTIAVHIECRFTADWPQNRPFPSWSPSVLVSKGREEAKLNTHTPTPLDSRPFEEGGMPFLPSPPGQNTNIWLVADLHNGYKSLGCLWRPPLQTTLLPIQCKVVAVSRCFMTGF